MTLQRATFIAAIVLACTCAQAQEVERRPMPMDKINPEQGFCYILNMDLGEDGYKEGNTKSHLRVLEDGKELGPVDNKHDNIRQIGGGRFSHWARTSLYFSTSDNSDPRTNGRKYEIASDNFDATPAPAPAAPAPATGWQPLSDEQLVELKRYTISPDFMSPEIGFAYTVSMDFGEDGDKETSGKSGIRVLEDGKELGPGKALHADIREKGSGRYSHWTHDGLYLSASDNSDPRTNGRKYEVVSINPDNAMGGITDRMGETKTVAWPKLVDNGRDWSTMDNMLASFTRGATNDQEKAMFIWQAMRSNRYHQMPLFPGDEFHDPVKMFNSYGLQLCDDMGYCGCSLFKHAGLGKPKYDIDPTVYALHGDIDQDAFYLDRECETPVSGDAIARDHDLVRREVHYGPTFGSWNSSESAAALFGSDDTRGFMAVSGHEMKYTLRPGERVEFRWDNVGKWVAYSEKWDKRPVFWANSKFVYEPRLAPDQYAEGVAEQTDIISATADGAQLAGSSADAKLVYEFAIPWAICGGTVRAEFVGLGDADRLAIDFSRDGETMTRIWEGGGKGPVSAEAAIDEALDGHNGPVAYKYFVVISLASADAARGANLKSLDFETDVMAAPLSLPRMRLGENVFAYSDRTEGEHEVTITHKWQEVHDYPLLRAPADPLFPPAGETISDSLVKFAWPEVEGASAYHIQVSRRADFRIPYRVGYDVIVTPTEWLIPYTGMFAPDTDYYWHVRAKDRKGAWSEWSPTWTFRWQGPRVPVNVRLEQTDQGVMLRWESNPRGERPVSYEVYGSDEKGFSIHKTAYTSYLRSEVPANFLGDTAETSMLVISADPTHENMNRAYYRVVAVDANGTQSICSDFAEVQRPHFWSAPPTEAKVGAQFSYRPGVISSLGDAQHRSGQNPTNQMWDREELSFKLVEGPGWLAIDEATGELSGKPDAAGTAKVIIKASTQFGDDARQEFELTVK
jgi:hypothetical protein